MEIISNGQYRDLVSLREIPERFQSDFDYVDESDYDSSRFFQYKGYWYDLDQFMRAPQFAPNWDGYAADSYFSGILVKFDEDGRVKVGRYCC